MLLSILIPAFHAQDFIARAVNSVVAQNHADCEIVVISDDGQDYRRIFAERDIASASVIFASTGKTGSGAAHARNIGLEHANGRIIATLDADDEFLPGKLDIMVPKAQAFGFCSCAMEYGDYGADGRWRQIVLPQPVKQSGLLSAAMYPSVNYLGNSMVLFDREAFPLRWPEELPAMEDIVFAMQAYDYADAIAHCPQPLHRYVRRAHSLSNGCDAPQQFIQAKQKILALLQAPDFCIKSMAARESLRLFISLSLVTEEAYARALQAGKEAIFPIMLGKLL